MHPKLIGRKIRKYPFPLVDRDLSGKLKLKTLEFFVFFPKWYTSKEISKEIILENPFYQSRWRCFSMRLMRYYRDGLLARKRKGKGFKYQITVKGEKRLLYLWKKHGSYKVDKKLSPKEATVKKKMKELRIKKAIYLLEKHKSLTQKDISNI